VVPTRESLARIFFEPVIAASDRAVPASINDLCKHLVSRPCAHRAVRWLHITDSDTGCDAQRTAGVRGHFDAAILVSLRGRQEPEWCIVYIDFTIAVDNAGATPATIFDTQVSWNLGPSISMRRCDKAVRRNCVCYRGCPEADFCLRNRQIKRRSQRTKFESRP
jgi:hypothetical protein